MKNYYTKILACNKQARIIFVENTDLIGQICASHNTNKLSATLLARTVSCASLLTGLLKDKHRVSLKVSASNRDYRVFADIDANRNVRGFISEELQKALNMETKPSSIEQIIGDRGYIQVINDIGMNSITTWITDMPYKNIIDDLSHYYKQSEQTPTWVSTDIVFNEQDQIELSRAILVQLLPGAPISKLKQIKRTIIVNKMKLLDSSNKAAMQELPFTIFEDAELLETKPIQLFCGCSKEMFFSMLLALGKEELTKAYLSDNPIELACNVCGNKYLFLSEELKNLL